MAEIWNETVITSRIRVMSARVYTRVLGRFVKIPRMGESRY